jgi:hypothetical protein
VDEAYRWRDRQHDSARIEVFGLSEHEAPDRRKPNQTDGDVASDSELLRTICGRQVTYERDDGNYPKTAASRIGETPGCIVSTAHPSEKKSGALKMPQKRKYAGNAKHATASVMISPVRSLGDSKFRPSLCDDRVADE